MSYGRQMSNSPIASRGRGRKQAKKGVQLTVMVVGPFPQSLLHDMNPDSRLLTLRTSHTPHLHYPTPNQLPDHTFSYPTHHHRIPAPPPPPLIGASGSGRTTFINTLCESTVSPHREPEAPEHAHIEQGIKIKPMNVGEFEKREGGGG